MFILVQRGTLQDSGELSGKCHRSSWPAFQKNSCSRSWSEGSQAVYRAENVWPKAPRQCSDSTTKTFLGKSLNSRVFVAILVISRAEWLPSKGRDGSQGKPVFLGLSSNLRITGVFFVVVVVEYLEDLGSTERINSKLTFVKIKAS